MRRRWSSSARLREAAAAVIAVATSVATPALLAAPASGPASQPALAPAGPVDVRQPLLVVADAPAAAATPAPDPPDAVARDLRDLDQILNGPDSTQAARDEAARRLVSRPGPESDAVLLRTLTGGARDPRVAVARALGSDPTPDERLVGALVPLLGSDLAQTEAAARALVVFKGNPAARDALTRFVDNYRLPDPKPAIAVLHAMAKLSDKATAAELVRILTTNTNARFRDAAADALIEMTGQERLGHDPARWQQWWERNGAKSDAEWARDILNQAAARLRDIEQRHRKLFDAMEGFLRASFERVPAAERGAFLVERLRHESDDVRLIAAKLAYDEVAIVGGRRDPAVLAELRKMIGDSSPDVRDRVIRTLGLWGDPSVVADLLTQLAQETDNDVRVSIIRALGPTHDLRAVEPLRRMLNDPAPQVARAAADALKYPDMADELRKPANAALARGVALELRERFRNTDRNDPAQRELRESVVEAMASLGHRDFADTFARLLDPRLETEATRLAALRGLARIADPETGNYVVPALKDPVPGIRQAAAIALRTTGAFGHVPQLADLLWARREPDPDVRAAAWETFVALLRKTDHPRALDRWADQFNAEPTAENLARRQQVLEIQEAMYAADRQAADELATVRLRLGMTLLDLGKPAEAATKLKLAVEYLEALPNAAENVKEPPRQQYLLALMRARKFEEARLFIQQVAGAAPASADLLWSRLIKPEVNRLMDAKEFETATSLLEQVKGVMPELIQGDIEVLQRTITARRGAGGRLYVRYPHFDPGATLLFLLDDVA